MPEAGDAERRLAVVTGAASGIGRATAIALIRQDCVVAAADMNEAGLEAAVAQMQRARGFAVDVGAHDSVSSFATQVISELGIPDVLINCAGWDEARPFLETDALYWERVVRINLVGVVAVTHAFLPAMVERGMGGRIVNVASDAARVGSSGETVYAGAKGGVVAFTKSLARETARHAITANSVCPGPTDTALFRAQPERLQQALVKAVPMRRLGTPEDVAHAICFFASECAGYITGQVLSVSGGLTMAG